MASTRTLILGAVRIYQPVHGYIVRRELVRWEAHEWAPLNPGSVYNALRTLEAQGFIEEASAPDTARGPRRTSYALTPAGDEEFLALVRQGLATPIRHHPEVLHAALCFIWALPREVVIPLLERRAEAIEQQRRDAADEIDVVLADPKRPNHVAEVINVRDLRLGGELEWTRLLLERVRAGSHTFAGESGGPWYVPVDAPG